MTISDSVRKTYVNIQLSYCCCCFFKNSKICLPLSFPPRSEIKNKKYMELLLPQKQRYLTATTGGHTLVYLLGPFRRHNQYNCTCQLQQTCNIVQYVYSVQDDSARAVHTGCCFPSLSRKGCYGNFLKRFFCKCIFTFTDAVYYLGEPTSS